ncbi:MAG: hypothetical protein GX219_00100 [Tissierellia bacterium]|nr:hypothetical protein [Tissierellia bacterium]
MRKILILLTVAIILVACQQINENAATVNGEEITLEEFESQYEIYRGINVKKYGEESLSKVQEDGLTIEQSLRRSVIDKMILDKLIERDCEEKGIYVSDEEYKEDLDTYIKKLSGEENYRRFLSENNISEESFENNIRKEVLAEKHKQSIEDSLSISNEELRTFFEDYKYEFEKVDISYILVKSKEEAEKIINRYKSGTSFEDLAILESLDKVTAVNGGQIGFIKRGEYPSEFELAAFALEEGDVSDPIEMEIGYYILKLNEKLMDFEDLKDDVLARLKDSKYRDYIAQLTENADIKIFVGDSK